MKRSRTTVDPRAYTQIVGSTFGNQEHRPLITIGARSWSKWQLGRIGCPHPAAAVRVAQMMKRLGISTPAEFLARAHEFGRYKTLGVTCYWTVLALARDLGGDIEQVHGDDRSFHSIHTQALKSSNGNDNHPRRTRRTT